MNRFYKLYDVVLSDNKLNLTDKVIYSIVDALSQKDGYCYASNESIAKKMCKSKKTIQSSINKLVELHYFTKWSLKNNHKNYRMLTTNKSILESEEEFKQLKQKARQNVELFDYDWLNEN